MKQFLFCILFVAFFLCSNAQANNKIVIGTIDTIHSKILNEQRTVWIHVPGDNTNDLYSRQRYPVVYLLDGDAHFYSVTGIIQQLSSVNGNTICPEMIVVGIPNTDRTRDLTPTHVVDDLPFVDSAFSRNSGGGEEFISFIEKELMPHIDSLYPTEPYRLLIGHSFGGLTVMNTFLHHTDLFNAYVVIDPSMWWDHEKLLKETRKALSEKKFKGVSLFLGYANTMENGMNITSVKKDTTGGTRHIRSILELSNYLAANKQNQLKYRSKYYGNDDHGSVPLIAEYDALHFIFNFYRLKLTMKDYLDTGVALVAKIEKHYKNSSKEMGYRAKPSESMINGLGYDALGSRQFNKAASLFRLNLAYYPLSSNVYDSMGDFYDTRGEKDNAISNYKKALSIKELPATRQKLEKLLAK